MDKAIRLLHLEDDPRDAGLLRDQLECDGLDCDIRLTSDGPGFEAAMREPWDVVVCDFSLPGYDGMTALAHSRTAQPRVPVILMSGSMRPEDAVACMRAGASDYVLKDRPERLTMAVKRALSAVSERARRERAEEALRENEERLRLAVEAAALEPWELDFRADRIFLSSNTKRELGLEVDSPPWTRDDWAAHIHPDDREASSRSLEASLRNGEPYHIECRMEVPSSAPIWVAAWGSLVLDSHGRPQSLVGLWQNITSRKLAEAEMVRSLHEKESLLREVHHRVNNNLQVIASLLRLEARRVTDPAVQASLSGMRNRIHSMALLHQTLYRSGRFSEVSLDHYLREVAANVARGFSTEAHGVEVRTDLHETHLNIDQAIPCGLIVNELVTNSLKHGFPGGRSGSVTVALEAGPDRAIVLRVSDTGVGLPPDLASRADGSMGLQLVSDLVRQVQGDLQVSAGPGAVFEVRFRAAPGRDVPEPLIDARVAPLRIP